MAQWDSLYLPPAIPPMPLLEEGALYPTAALLLQGPVGQPALDLRPWPAIRVFPHTWKWVVWQADEKEWSGQLGQYLKAQDGDKQSRWLAAPHWGSVGCPLSTWKHCLFLKKSSGLGFTKLGPSWAASVSLDLLLEYSDVFFKEWIISFQVFLL